jgi:hypothetical protein
LAPRDVYRSHGGCHIVAFSLARWGCTIAGFLCGSFCRAHPWWQRMIWHSVRVVAPLSCRPGASLGLGSRDTWPSSLARGRALPVDLHQFPWPRVGRVYIMLFIVLHYNKIGIKYYSKYYISSGPIIRYFL